MNSSDSSTGPAIDYIGLTERLGLPAHEQAAVLAWTGENTGHLWTEAEAAELAEVWAADTERITRD